MGSFYAVSSPVRIVFAVLALLSFLIQTVSLLLQFSRLDGASRLSRSAFEGMLTVHLALLAFLLVSFQDQTLQGSAALTAHAAVRWAGVPTALAGICAAVPEKRRSPVLISALFSAATLPCSDVLFGRDFAWVFMACVLFFLLRGIAGLLSGLRHLKNNLSRLSLKEAVDTLHGGVLFAAAGGRIVLQNRSMLALIHRITGRSASNANELWALLRSPVDAEDVTVTALGETLLVRLPDAAWEFSCRTIAACRRTYTLICAADVTETDRVTRGLAAVTDELARTADRLQYVLDHYEEVKRAREAVGIRRHIHDIMGQRVSILNRALLYAPDSERIWADIAPLLSDLMGDIRNRTPDRPETVLRNMERSFALAGAELITEGALPADGGRALLFLKIVREAATNALRHAGATRICVRMTETEAGYAMTVTNNGTPPAGEIAEGGGITGMRERLAQAGGLLTIETVPVFRLTASLPK